MRKVGEKPKLPIGYSAPRWSAEIADCSMPMTFDQYSMCGYGCVYCFAVYQKAIGAGKKNYLGGNLRCVDVERIKRVFSNPCAETSQFWRYIQDKKFMQWGSLADPFCIIEKKFGVGLELLRFFREIDYPIRFSTKATWWLDDPRYTELFKGNPNWHVMFSIITLDANKASTIERTVPSPQARLDAIEKFANLKGGRAILRLRPYMIGISDPGDDLVTAAGLAGAKAVSTEFFCLEQRSLVLRNNLELFNRLSDIDYWAFYKKYSYTHGYMRLNRNVKRAIIDRLQAAARKAHMDFAVSDAHFKERSTCGSCCGLPKDANYSRGQFCEALRICREHGKVTWDDISGDMEHLKVFLWRKADGYNTGSCEERANFHKHTMYDYMLWLWNNPKAGQSPYRMFEGIMKPVSKDSNGNLVYVYDNSRA